MQDGKFPRGNGHILVGGFLPELADLDHPVVERLLAVEFNLPALIVDHLQ